MPQANRPQRRPESAMQRLEFQTTTPAVPVLVSANQESDRSAVVFSCFALVSPLQDGNVIHFVNPKVQASIASNTYVVSGASETRKLQELLPGIITQLGPDNLEHLKKIYANFAQHQQQAAQANTADSAEPKDEDDDVPDLVENFEQVSKGEPNSPTPANQEQAKTKSASPKKNAKSPKKEVETD